MANWLKDSRIRKQIRETFARLPQRTVYPNATKIRNRSQAVKVALSKQVSEGNRKFSKALDTLPMLHGGDSCAIRYACSKTIMSRDSFKSKAGHDVHFSITRPAKTSGASPAAIYFHGGGMASFSCFLRTFQNFAKLIASKGVVVCMVDFRNSLYGENAAPFPAGLDDCVESVKWLSQHRDRYGILPGSAFLLAGESGGANLAIATALRLKQEKHGGLVGGIYMSCPFISGEYPSKKYPSSKENEGIVLSADLMNIYARAYGDGISDSPLAWPSNCSPSDLLGLPPVHISVNEFDPLKDEGLEFYHKCMSAGVRATCCVEIGTVHGTGNFLPGVDIDMTKHVARSISAMCAAVATRTNEERPEFS